MICVTQDTCEKLKGTDKPFILVLKLGDDLFECLVDCASRMDLASASLSGLGALSDVTVGYYYLSKKQYHTKIFKGMMELVSLNGNITIVDNKPFLHIHAALGGEDFLVVGGHIMEATVGPTAEICIIPFAEPIHREYDEHVGLKLMCPFAKPL